MIVSSRPSWKRRVVGGVVMIGLGVRLALGIRALLRPLGSDEAGYAHGLEKNTGGFEAWIRK